MLSVSLMIHGDFRRSLGTSIVIHPNLFLLLSTIWFIHNSASSESMIFSSIPLPLNLGLYFIYQFCFYWICDLSSILLPILNLFFFHQSRFHWIFGFLKIPLPVNLFFYQSLFHWIYTFTINSAATESMT